jgi:nicotinamidase-related amidase
MAAAVANRSAVFLTWLDQWYNGLREMPLEAVIREAGGPAGVACVSVDMVVGFCSEGPLSSPRVGALAPRIAALLRRAYAAGVREFVFTQDAHPEDSPEFAAFGPHCIRGTREAETVPELRELPFADTIPVIPKRSLSSTISTDFGAWLAARPHLRRFLIVGDCTDLCVYQAAMDLKLRANADHLPYQVIVPDRCVDTYDVPVDVAERLGILPHDGDLLHRLFLYHMALNGVSVVRDVT